AARRWRVDLPGRRNEGSEPVVSVVAARAPLRVVRRRHAHRPGAGGADDHLAFEMVRLAEHIHLYRIRGADLAAAVVSSDSGADARHLGRGQAATINLGAI